MFSAYRIFHDIASRNFNHIQQKCKILQGVTYDNFSLVCYQPDDGFYT
jgi:hypothetical protein